MAHRQGVRTPQDVAKHVPHRERDNTTVMNLRTAHSFWDRSARDFEALVRKSGSHPNTTGCKFEKDLVLIIKTGALLDSAVKSFEQTFIEGKSFSDEEIKKAADVSNNVLTLAEEESVGSSRVVQAVTLDHALVA